MQLILLTLTCNYTCVHLSLVTASFGCLWQNQAIVTQLFGTWGKQLPNRKIEPLANHAILLGDQYACQDVRFTCRHCDRFAKHASLPGNGVTTHRDCMKAARWLTATEFVFVQRSRSGSSAVIWNNTGSNMCRQFENLIFFFLYALRASM